MLFIGLIAALIPTAALAAPQAEKAQGLTECLRWLSPLPKEVSIEQQVTVPSAQVRISLRDGAGELEQNAARTLRTLFVYKAGADARTEGEFEILLGVCDKAGRIDDAVVPDAERLGTLPNSDQAYLIRPVGPDRLLLTGLEPAGVFYAALTMRQLLESRFNADTVTIPLATITDWPDMAERGEWGCSSVRDIEWLAQRKMNLVEFHTKHEVDKQGVPAVEISESLVRRGRLNAVRTVPIISHLNGMGNRGVYVAYPQLRGTGKKALYESDSRQLWAPCASNPKLHEIMAAWMRGYARYGLRDISCWLGELSLRCECEQCAKVGQFPLETRAFVKAWQLARQDHPDLRIRILLTQGSYETNDEVLAQVPPEVGVTYYDGGKTYDSSRDPMIYPLLEEYAAGGRWLGCYPQLTPSWRIVSPWSCPQFIKSRMTEFVDKKLVSLGGYVVPDNYLFDFNVSAAAEWSWNAHGRDEYEFALSWATRKGLSRPEDVAQWAVLLGPVSWDIYGARLVERYFFRPATIEGMVASRSRPAFGQGMFRYIPDAQHLAGNLQACRKAMRLAEGVGSPAIKAETAAVLTYYEMLDQLCALCDLLAEKNAVDTDRRVALQTHMNRLALAGALNVEALRDWERAVRVGAGLSRFREGTQATENAVSAAARALAPFGVRNPALMLMSTKLGGWDSEDFRQQAAIEKTVDVSDQLAGPGMYQVTFQYTGGWNGVATSRATLIAEPKDGNGEPVEIDVDEHPGTTGHRSNGNSYSLRLDSYDPGMRYRIVGRIRGTRPQDQQPGRTGCSGAIYLRRERDPDWQVRIMGVLPLSPDEASATLKTGFSGKGIPVGVVVGGYGSKSLLNMLEGADGIDALAIGIGSVDEDECQVVILPQLRSDMVPAELAEQLSTFVGGGGGLITTHDAVGYRSMPVVCPRVCAGGVEHVRHESWKLVAEHPVTQGLAADRALTQGYYDHILLQAGPEGTVLAVGEESGKPVLVAGTLGKGRCVACGLLPGLDADGEEAAPSADETMLILNAIRWCAGEQ